MRSILWVDDVLRDRMPPWQAVGASPTEVLEVCAALEISELVHHRVTRGGTTSDWPTEVRRELERRTRSSMARELVRAREIAQVLEALAARAVSPIILKGAALAHTTYDSPAMRPHVDTDLLIARDHVAIVRDTLAHLGYTEPPMTDGELVFCQFQMTKVDAFGIHHVFDVHWKISTHTMFADLLTYTEMQADAVAIPALGPQARTTSAAHALLLACVHPVMHHGNTDRLIWLFDIDVLVRRLSAGGLDSFARLALSKRVAGICARQLSLAGERFSTPIPSDVMQMLTSSLSEPAAVYLRPRRRWHHELFWNVRNLQAWDDRVRLLREVLFPSARYMLDTYRLGPRGVLLVPALYVHRCARGAWKILVGRK